MTPTAVLIYSGLFKNSMAVFRRLQNVYVYNLGQNYHNFNVSSMPKSTPYELSVESLSEKFPSDHNQIVTCRPRKIQSSPIPSLAEASCQSKVSVI